ncbi:hypothetical protein ROE7235_02299 [Roseibaca ekhonensis]|uniref:DUF7742 domain-containing protein n=1 Tax=Roseinatronobacter ekhonensis TaxID=254356 RepID=A0A3B0MG85_9RHOB|nr:hypothetical protein [Roseibaca ekhonensis]SUZ32538.1 hypothetical protein ROE7235_02299 [Roseibaca ekhonensis]
MRPVTPTDLLAAAQVLLQWPDDAWPEVAAALLDEAARADRFRRRHGLAHPRLGNGTVTSAALARGSAPAPAAGDRRFLSALAAVIAAVLARSEGLEGHGRQCAADTGNIEQRF